MKKIIGTWIVFVLIAALFLLAGCTKTTENGTYDAGTSGGSAASSEEQTETPTADGGLLYTLSDNGWYYSVTGVKENAGPTIVVPAEYGELPVRIIGACAFEKCKTITHVEIASGVTIIEASAFEGCTNLSSVVLPDSVMTIEEYAFCDCAALTAVTFGNGLQSIGTSAFQNCQKLAEITLPQGLQTIGDYAFRQCRSLVSITVPDSVTSIGKRMLGACRSLESMTLPFVGSTPEPAIIDYPIGEMFGSSAYTGGIRVTQDYRDTVSNAVYDRYRYTDNWYEATRMSADYYIPASLHNVTIRGGTITAGAFSGCTQLTNVTLGANVTEIGDYAFYGCTNLTEVIIAEGIIGIGQEAFRDCASLTALTVPDSVAWIREDAFSGCGALQSLSVPFTGTACLKENSPLYIWGGKGHVLMGRLFGTQAYEGGVRITQEYYNGNISPTPIAFYIPATLKSIRISRGRIGAYAFENFSNLEEITIGRDVNIIDHDAFTGCTGLKAVYIDDLTAWFGISFKEGNGSNPLWYATDFYVNGELVTDITVPAGVTSIGDKTFFGFKSLKSVTIPGTVTSIGQDAFCGCMGLEQVVIESGVTSIDHHAFYGCSKLTDVVIPDSVTNLGGTVFWECANLSSVTIGNGVTTLLDHLFYHCGNLTSVTIPTSVTTMRTHLFNACTKLTDITYSGTMAEWDAIEKASTWDYNMSNYTVHCKDGNVPKS